jgi:hypothetical protein
MVKALRDQEKKQQIDSQVYEHKLISTINTNDDLKTYVSQALVGLDTSTIGKDPTVQPTSLVKPTQEPTDFDANVDSSSIVGTWKIVTEKGEPADQVKSLLRYHFGPDSKLTLDGDIIKREFYYTYQLSNDGHGTFTYTGNNLGKKEDDDIGKTKCFKFSNGQVYLYYSLEANQTNHCQNLDAQATRILRKVSDD